MKLGFPRLAAGVALAVVLAVPSLASAQTTRVLVAREGDSFLEEIDGQRVLHLTGDPYAMGVAHGKLLAAETRECMDAYLKDFAYARMNYTREYLLGIFEKSKPFIPQEYLDEMRGLADGAGVDLLDVQAVHIIPELHHCSGAAVFGKMTKDGQLYHYRSLDYSLHLGAKKKVQENACLIIRKPTKGYATAIVGWAGTLGCVTGMNDQGISIGEMGSSSFAETFAGTPMWFRLRWILENSKTLDEGLKGFSEWKRTCGYNFIITDGKIPDCRAVEVDKTRVAFFSPGGAEENVAPHEAIPFAVRRVNHFVDRELAGHQRRPYDPLKRAKGSYEGYAMIGEFLKKNAGQFDEKLMIEGLCKGYPKGHSCLHQAVFRPIDGKMWVANAKDPTKCENAGAQNQTFYAYDLKALLATDPATLPKRTSLAPRSPRGSIPDVIPAKLDESPAPPAPTTPKVGPDERLIALLGGVPTGEGKQPALAPRDEDEKIQKALDLYKQDAGSFPFRLIERDRLQTYRKHEVRFPSALHTTDQSDVVAGWYYEPLRRAEGERLPGCIVVHHLGGSFEAEEIMAAYLAQHGVASMTIALPGYGIRRAPKQPRAGFLGHENPADDLNGMRQAVLDVRRAADLLRARPEVDGSRVGVVGVSLGALVAADASSIDTRFARTVLVIGGGDFTRVLLGGSKEAQEAMAHVKKTGLTIEQLKEGFDLVDPLTFGHRLRSSDVLMLNAEKDEIFPRESTIGLWRKAGFPRIKWYPCGHYGIVAHIPDVLNETLQHLKGRAPERQAD